MNELEFLIEILTEYQQRSEKVMQGHQDIGKIFDKVKKKIEKLEGIKNVKKFKD